MDASWAAENLDWVAGAEWAIPDGEHSYASEEGIVPVEEEVQAELGAFGPLGVGCWRMVEEVLVLPLRH